MQRLLKIRPGRKSSSHAYPSKYERLMPWVFGAIGVFILALVGIIILVLVGGI